MSEDKKSLIDMVPNSINNAVKNITITKLGYDFLAICI